MIPPHFRTIREWMMRHDIGPYDRDALRALLEERIGVPADVLIDPDRIEAVRFER